MRRSLWTLALVAAAGSARAAEDAPPVYEMVLPANAHLVAVLPVAGAPDQMVLDLRTEVVLPLSCGDKIAGLMRKGGPRLDGPDAYDVILERNAVGECKKDATRISARWAVRMKLPDHARRELVLGPRAYEVAREGDKVTLDGEPATGDVPGAPPTAAPATFVTGEASAAQLVDAKPLTAPDALAITVATTAKWPRCAKPAIGLLGSGDLASKFLLDKFVPLAIAPLDGSCGARTIARKDTVRATVRLPWKHDEGAISVGAAKLALKRAPAATPAPATKATTNAPAKAVK